MRIEDLKVGDKVWYRSPVYGRRRAVWNAVTVLSIHPEYRHKKVKVEYIVQPPGTVRERVVVSPNSLHTGSPPDNVDVFE